MADYVGSYANDYDRVVGLAKLQVYLVNGATLTTSRGIRENTTPAFDADYLPSVFLNAVELFARGLPVCPLSTTPRFAKLYLTSDSYLHVELPFRPSTSEYNQFFIAVGFNFDLLTIGIEGERIDPYPLTFNANG